MQITITEALAEIKMIGNRVAAKRELIRLHTIGGSASRIASETQLIVELEHRLVALRRAIFRGNDETVLTLDARGIAVSRTVNEWLIWRREIVPPAQKHQQDLLTYLATVRRTVSADVTSNYPETAMIEDAEILAELLAALDGQLSLKNATVLIDVPD